MASFEKSRPLVTPRIIIHGGAGNIKRSNMPADSYAGYRSALSRILKAAYQQLSLPGATALDVATYAVSLFEDDPLFNAGHGAVFTRAGTNELEASVMVSNGHHKRGVGCILLKHVKNPIKLARELLIRGDEIGGGGAGAHCQLAGKELEGLAKTWGLEIVPREYFWTQRRWDEHLRGLERERGQLNPETTDMEAPRAAESGLAVDASSSADDGLIVVEMGATNDPHWDGKEYLPQGTVGCVVLDSFGTICAATSTGGLTNKLPGRIGDTPTLGAGFWAEEWTEVIGSHQQVMSYQVQPPVASSPLDKLSRGNVAGVLSDCLPGLVPSSSGCNGLSATPAEVEKPAPRRRRRAVGMSGTGNGDSFLRVSAVRTAAAISRFSTPNLPLSVSLRRVAGPGGELQQSAGDRWGVTGEGEGGIIGIELVGNKGNVVWDLNCGGMFRAWLDDEGVEKVAVFADEDGSVPVY